LVERPGGVMPPAGTNLARRLACGLLVSSGFRRRKLATTIGEDD